MRNDPLKSYRKSQVFTADPVVLVRLLLEESIRTVHTAATALRAGDVMERGQAVSKGIELLTELMLDLNTEESPELAGQLGALYEYCQHRLLEGHSLALAAAFEEVLRILGNIHEPWVDVMRRGQQENEGETPAEYASAPLSESAWV